MFENIVLITSIVFFHFANDELAHFYIILGMLYLLNIAKRF